jgi:hypothetical protein
MKKITSTLLLAGFIICLLTSCASTRQSWSNPEFVGRKMGKTMVMGIGDSKTLLYQYETMFVNGLANYGVSGKSMHIEFPETDDLKKEEIVALLQTNQFDSILVTHLLATDDRQRRSVGSFTPSLDDNNWSNVQVYIFVPNTSYVQNLMEYVLETNLYDVHSKQLVWSGRKRVYDNSSDLANLKKIIRGVIEDLHIEKML